MKIIKLIQSGIVLLFIFTFNLSVAQVQYEKTNSADAMAERMTKYEVQQLNLDAKEAESLSQINLLYTQQLVAIRKQNASNNNKSEIEALERSHSQKIRSLLSSEKFQKYLALKEDREKDDEEPQEKN